MVDPSQTPPPWVSCMIRDVIDRDFFGSGFRVGPWHYVCGKCGFRIRLADLDPEKLDECPECKWAGPKPHDYGDAILHRLWTKAVGTADYCKEEWKALEKLVHAGIEALKKKVKPS